jgi:GH24 family phage-related lysozyme (muramidase)
MGSYKDMINMIGNVKHVPMIIEDAILKSRQIMNTGGTFDPYNQNMGGPTFTDVTLDNPQERGDVGDPRDGLEPRVGDSGVTEAGVGTSVSRQSGIIDRKATKGGGSLSLTPYNIDTTIENPFVNPSVMMYENGGTTTEETPKVDNYGYYTNYVKSVEASDAVMKKTPSIIPKPGGGFYKAFENGRYYPYKDVGGKVTIGFGRTNSAVKGLDIENDYKNGITVKEANDFLRQDINSNMKSLSEDFDGKFGEGEFEKLSEIEKLMLVDFEYNLGNAVKKFPKFMDAIRTGNVKKAAAEYKRHSYKNKGKPNEIKRELGRNKVFYNSYLGDWIKRHGGEDKGYIPGVVSLPMNQNMNTMVSLPMNQDMNTMVMNFKKGGKFKNGGKKKNLDEPVTNVMLPEIEFVDLKEESYNKLSQPQKNIYDAFKASDGQAQFVEMPDGRLVHYTKLMKMVEDLGMDKIINEPHMLAKQFPKKMGTRFSRFRPHFNPFTRNIHIAFPEPSKSGSKFVENINMQEYVSDLIAESAHFPQFYRLRSIFDVPYSFSRDINRYFAGEDMEQSYSDPYHFEYQTHTAPDSFENQLMDKYTSE